jgi:hypothetical protein
MLLKYQATFVAEHALRSFAFKEYRYSLKYEWKKSRKAVSNTLKESISAFHDILQIAYFYYYTLFIGSFYY